MEPPPGYGEDGQPLPGHGPDGLQVEEWTTVRRKRRGPKKKREGRAIPMPRPVEMTRAEMEQHRREGHANYHPGCAHCVKSRAIADQHRRTEGSGREEEDDGRLPTIAADLCFLGSQSDEDKLTVLAMIDGKSGTLFGIPSPDKAIINGEYSEYVLNKVLSGIDSLGYKQDPGCQSDPVGQTGDARDHAACRPGRQDRAT